MVSSTEAEKRNNRGDPTVCRVVTMASNGSDKAVVDAMRVELAETGK